MLEVLWVLAFKFPLAYYRHDIKTRDTINNVQRKIGNKSYEI
jgi:hypothetical protein